MLKISKIERTNGRWLVIQGKLVPPWTAELKRAFEQARVELDDRQLVLHILALTAISREGEDILLELMGQGVKLRSSGVFGKQTLRQLAGRLAPADQVTRPFSRCATGMPPKAVDKGSSRGE